MQIDYKQLFDNMRSQASDKDKRRLFVNNSIEILSKKKDDDEYIKFRKVLLRKLKRDDSWTDDEIKKSIDNGEFLPQQKEICDNLYDKIFNRLEPEYKDSSAICQICLVKLDPYDDDVNNDRCNVCDIINLLPFYSKRLYTDDKSQLSLEENALIIFNNINLEYMNVIEFQKFLNGKNEFKATKDFMEGFMNTWILDVKKVIDSVEKRQYKTVGEELKELTTYEKILKISSLNRNDEKLFSIKDFQYGLNPYSIKDYIMRIIYSYKESDVDKYISVLGKEIDLTNPLRDTNEDPFYVKSDNASHVNFLIKQLLEQKKNYEIYASMLKKNELDRKILVDKNIVLSDEQKKVFRMRKIKYEMNKYKEKKEKAKKVIDDLLKQIRNDQKKKCVQESKLLSDFLDLCTKILDRAKGNNLVDYEVVIDDEIDYLLKIIGYNEIVDILSKCNIIKMFNDESREYVYYNKNFPYDNNGFLINFEEGKNEFKYLNKLLNLLSFNIERKKFIEETIPYKSYDEFKKEGDVVEYEEDSDKKDDDKKDDDKEKTTPLKDVFEKAKPVVVKPLEGDEYKTNSAFDIILNNPGAGYLNNKRINIMQMNNLFNSGSVFNTKTPQGVIFSSLKSAQNTNLQEMISEQIKKGTMKYTAGVSDLLSKHGRDFLNLASQQTVPNLGKVPFYGSYGVPLKQSIFNKKVPAQQLFRAARMVLDGRSRVNRRKVSKSHKKSRRRVSKSPKKSRRKVLSKSPKKSRRKVFRSGKKSRRKVSKSPKKNRRKSIKNNKKW